MNGNNILIYLNDSAIAGTKSNEMQTDCDMIEISSPSVGDWKTYMAGRKGWTVQTSFLVTAVSNIRQLLNVGTSYTLVFRDRSNTSSVTGTAILQTCRITATRGNLIQGQFSFQGSGALS